MNSTGRSCRITELFFVPCPNGRCFFSSKHGLPRLSHPWFEERDKKSIYPNPMSRRKVLCFHSLWNQCVGKLLHRYKPHVYHCPDFHACIAPWYALQNQDPADPAQLRMLLVLHNAEYQGSVSTDMIRERQCEKVARIFNMSEDFIFAHLTAEGRVNMLKAGVDFLLAYQERGADVQRFMSVPTSLSFSCSMILFHRNLFLQFGSKLATSDSWLKVRPTLRFYQTSHACYTYYTLILLMEYGTLQVISVGRDAAAPFFLP